MARRLKRTKLHISNWRDAQAYFDMSLRQHVYIGDEKRCACCYERASNGGLTCTEIFCPGEPTPIMVMKI